MKKIKVGILGFGLSGRVFHAGLLRDHPSYEVVAVSSRRADEVQAALPGAVVCATPLDVIQRPEIDLVINCLPNTLHFSMTKIALEKGKHVVVEKPFVNSVSEAEELIALAEQKKLILSVFQNRRWDSDFLTLRKLMRKNTLGGLKQFESHFDRWRPVVRTDRWREQAGVGTGVWLDLGAHLLDQAVTLFGVPQEVTADISTQKTGGATDDYFHVVLKYGSLRVILHSSSFALQSPRFLVQGDKANFVKYGLDPQEEQLKRGLSARDESFGREQEKDFGALLTPEVEKPEVVASERGAYVEYYNGLYRSLTDSAIAPPVTASEALTIIKLLTLAQESSRTQRTLDAKSVFA